MRKRGRKRSGRLEEDLQLFIDDLCVNGGFCNDLKALQLLAKHPVVSAQKFARAVLEAEGMDPERNAAHLRLIVRRFTDRYGQDEVTGEATPPSIGEMGGP